MGVYEALRVLARHWEEVREQLSRADYLRLVDSVETLSAHSGDDEFARALAVDLCEFLAFRLPSGSPVRAAIVEDDAHRFADPRPTVAPGDWPAAIAELRWHATSEPLRPTAEPATSGWPPTPEQVASEAAAWVLAEPALSAAEVSSMAQDPDDIGLIRLDRADGEVRLPAFQFGPDGTPVPIVLAINMLLHADDDPWGVADWWLGQNSWLNAVPTDLIGDGHDDQLLRAARAEADHAV